MAGDDFEFEEKRQYITRFGGWYLVTVFSGSQSVFLIRLPTTKRMSRAMPSVRDAPRRDARDDESVWIGDDVVNKAAVFAPKYST